MHFIFYYFSNKTYGKSTKVLTLKLVVMCKSLKTGQIPASRGAEIRFSRIILLPDLTNYSGKPRLIQVGFPSLRYVSSYYRVGHIKFKI